MYLLSKTIHSHAICKIINYLNWKMQKNDFNKKLTFNLCGELFFSDKPLVMGILNLTPDSFYDGGRYNSDSAMLTQAALMLEQGADFIDAGAASTRPGAAEVDELTERNRIVNALKAIKKEFPKARISVDTYRSSVARAAVDSGAVIINDVSGGQMDAAMFKTVAACKVPYVLMHMRGTPATMQQHTLYDNLLKDISLYFAQKVAELRALGVSDIILDPGFGFAKTPAQNFELLNRLQEFSVFDLPVLAGISRKSTIYKTLGITPDEALNGTTVLNTAALLHGASLLRVHDVKEAVECVKLVSELRK